MWPTTFEEAFEIATRYMDSRQYTDAKVEFLKAAACARDLGSEGLETIMLDDAFLMADLAEGCRG